MINTNKMLRRIAVVLLAVLVLGMGSGALAASYKARINSASAKAYASPSTGSKSVSGGKGLTVSITAYSGNWARISYKGKTAYMQLKHLNLTNRIKGYTKSSTPVYRSASSSSRMATLPVNSTVYVVGRDGSYFRVENASGSMTGYVRTNALSKSRVKTVVSSGSSSSSGSNASSSSTSKIDKVIALAKSFVGRPYGYNEPSSFNCSSLVEYCMEKYGFSMASTASAQAAMGNKIYGLSNVKKGDVLCFDTDGNGSCDHTAISLSGKGSSFIEASQGAGKVRTNGMDSYYKSCFMHAIRPE